jgi:hypothetical protein
MSTPRPCQRCERVRPIQGFECCVACYFWRRRRGLLPVKLPAGYFPCRRCGIAPRSLVYRHPGSYRMARGICQPCQQVAYRRRVAVRRQAAYEGLAVS